MKKSNWFLLLSVIVALSCVLTACTMGGGSTTAAGGESTTAASGEPTIIVTLDESSLSLKVGETETLTASVSVSGLSVIWTSSNEAVVTVRGGIVTAVATGMATVTAKIGNIKAECTVTVTANAPQTDPVISEEEGYEGEIYFFIGATTDDAALKEGLSAKDGNGKALDITVSDRGGFDATKLGSYTVKYVAVDESGREGEFTRTAYVTYFGITDSCLSAKALSLLNSWSYTPAADESISGKEWEQFVVPGHSTNWNRFEGPVDTYLVMHGSDTNGREALSDEIDDEDPNTILYNKLTVPEANAVFRVFCSNNPYPDFNNLLSRVRVSVYDIATDTFMAAETYREIKAPLNATQDGLDYTTIRTLSYQDFDLSAYAGKQVIVFIEQDAPEDVYQADFYRDTGYLDFQIDPLISETRDTLVIYSMKFIAGEEKINTSALTTDTVTSWGLEDKTDYTLWGLRGDEVAKGKWQVVYLNGATGSLNNVTGLGGSLQLIAREVADNHDGAIIVRDAALMNMVAVGDNKYFEIYVGTDTDSVCVNYRLTFITSDGSEIHLTPKFSVAGYTPVAGGWATIQKSQWVEGVKLIYDVSAFAGQTVVVLIEQDENAEAGEGNCTLWFNKARFVSDMTFAPADYTAYNELKNTVEAAGYVEDTYTEMSWSIYTDALLAFNKVSMTLVNEQQSDIDTAVKNLNDAISLLTVKPEPLTPPADPTDGTLTEELVGLTTSAWLNLPVDASGIWGTDASLAEYWGLRGDKSAKAAFVWYKAGDGALYHAAELKASLQSIAYEADNDTDDGFGADAMFANKVWVRGNFLRIFVGCDGAFDTVNVRLRLILADGSIVTPAVLSFTEGEATPADAGWFTIKASQWIYGTALTFDVGEYNDDVVTILIEQDQNETGAGITCTMWLNKVEFIAGADYTAYHALKAAVIEAAYEADSYTEASFTGYTDALAAFNAVSMKLTVEQQAVLDAAVKALNDAIAALTLKDGGMTLEHEVAGFNDAAWKALTVDTATVWGTDDADGGTWGMRGDANAKAKWVLFGTNCDGQSIYILDTTEATDDDATKTTDNLLANKLTVPMNSSTFYLWVGSDWSVVGSNVRVSIVTADGKIHLLSASYTEVGATIGTDGWTTVSASQWVYGTKIGYDMSDYSGQDVTVLIEQDGVGTGRSTLWVVKAAFAE